MTRKQIDALRAKQLDAQRRMDSVKEDVRKATEAQEPITDELRKKGTEAKEEFLRLGTEIADAEAEFAKGLDDNQEFLRSLSADVTGAAPVTPSAPDGSTGLELTRDVVDLFQMRMRNEYGSNGETPFNVEVDRASEALILDMLTSGDNDYIARTGEFMARSRKLKGFQARHTDAITAGGTTQGGILVPDDNTFMNEVQLAMLAFGGVANVARTISTPTGRPLPIPTLDDTAATGAAVIAENAAAADVDLTFGEKAMGAHMITSGRLSATEQAIEDAGPTLPMLIGMLASERIMRREALNFAEGDGAGKPAGLTNQFQVDGVTFQYSRAASAYREAANVWETFIDMKYSVNPAYRAAPRFSLVMTDTLDRFFARATDGDKRPLFKEWGLGNTAMGAGMRFGGMNILSDYSLTNPALGANASGLPLGFIGDFSWFWIRRVAGMVMRRDPYTNAANFATNWVFGRRCDSRGLFNTGANPAIRQIALNVVA